MTRNWIKVSAIFDSARVDWSPCAEVFDRHGCPGTLEEGNALTAYLAQVEGCEQRLEALTRDLKEFGAREVLTEIVPEEDWSSNWKQFFKSRKIGHVVICPTWEEYEAAPGEVVITLDPGQAFGTGDHPTTRLCLELMQEVEIKGATVADIGCGSGILAIAAVKLGAASVVASDIDAQSVEIARENARMNSVELESVDSAEAAPAWLCAESHDDCPMQTFALPGFEALGDPLDIVLSNIISATLIRLAPDAAKYVKSGGKWIVSGIIEQNWNDVRQTAERVGFELVTMKQEGEWIGATFRR